MMGVMPGFSGRGFKGKGGVVEKGELSGKGGDKMF